MHKIFQTIWILLLIISAANMYAQEQKIPDKKQVFTVAIDDEYEPYEFVNNNFQAVGFTPSVLNEIGKSAGVEFVFKPMTWTDAIKALKNGDVDIVSMIYSDERAKDYDFSVPHSIIKQALFINKNVNNIVDLASLKGHTVGFQENDISYNNLLGRKDFNKQLFNSKLDGFLHLNLGQVDAFFCAQQAGINLISKYKLNNINVVNDELFPQKFSFATRKGNQKLIELLNTHLAKLIASGKLQTLTDTWLSKKLVEHSWLEKNYLIFVLIGSLFFVIFIIIIFWNRSLSTKIHERTKTIRESEKLFQTVANYTFDWEYWENEENKLVYISPSCERITGYTREEFTSNSNLLELIVHPDDLEKFRKHHFSTFSLEEKDKIIENEFRINTKSGQLIYIGHICRPIFDENNKFLGRRVSNRDITESKKAQLSLKESEEIFRRLFEESADPILLLSDTGFTDCNQAAVSILGYPSKENFLNKQPWQFSPEKQPDGILSNIKTIEMLEEARQKGSNRFEWVHTKLDGTYLPVEVMLTPITIKGKQIFYTIWRDITEWKKAEIALQDSEARYRELFENAPIGIYRTTPDGQILAANPALINLLGNNSFDELANRNIEKDSSSVYPRSKFIEQIERDGYVIGLEEQWYRKDKSIIFVRENAHLVRDNSGNILYYDGTIEDITERKEKEIIIKQQTKKLQELNTSKDKFFSIIAHDLRSPFQGLINLTGLMSEDIKSFSPAELSNISGEMHKTVNNLFKLLKNLLEWAQMQQGTMKFSPKRILLPEIVQDEIIAASNRAAQKEITLINNANDNIYVFADNDMLHSILRNLISNSIKFSEKGGIIIIKSRIVEDDKVEISVADKGIGMSPEHSSKLFKVGEKVGRIGTDGEASTGLGLILCKEFILKNSGSIWVKSSEGIGSTFYFTLPKSEEPIK